MADDVIGALDGKVVLLTGASGGIGSVTAATLGAGGASLVAHYGRNREGAEAAVAALPEERRLLVQADLAQTGAARGLFAEAVAWRGRVDVVVVNAATLLETPIDGSNELWDENWDATLRVNVLEPVSLMREAVRHFLDVGGGTIVALSSWAAERGSAIASLSAYAAWKAAVRNVAQTIARNYAKDGILVYVVAPGIVHTPMSEISAVARGGIDAVNVMLAMGEMVPPEEVAELIAFLATGRSRHLSGATIDVNGATYIR
jgi:NAD(P)-dependent dehydrogenase (short-subunit alcohol dehydrogenase family)